MATAYTSHQLDEYLDYIDFPPTLRSAPRDIHFLTILHAYQISKIPYDNLSLHYNPDHCNSLDPQALFEKFTANGRGGYCMETTIFYRNILRALGFDVYTAPARIRLRDEHSAPHGDFIGWVHCVNIVTLPTGRYSIDVGFGGDGATFPMPLLPSSTSPNLGTQEIRLVHAPAPPPADASTTGPKVTLSLRQPANQLKDNNKNINNNAGDDDDGNWWYYQYRNNENAEWTTYYTFPEREVSDAELDAMNAWTSLSDESFQRHTVLVIKFLWAEQARVASAPAETGDVAVHGESGGRITGKIMLVKGRVKRNLGARTEVVQECKTEGERVEALRRWFGISLSRAQIEGIRGWRTELTGWEGQ